MAVADESSGRGRSERRSTVGAAAAGAAGAAERADRDLGARRSAHPRRRSTPPPAIVNPRRRFGAAPSSCDAPAAPVPCSAEFNMYMHRAASLPAALPCCPSRAVARSARCWSMSAAFTRTTRANSRPWPFGGISSASIVSPDAARYAWRCRCRGSRRSRAALCGMDH
jgi:hypothetical protein